MALTFVRIVQDFKHDSDCYYKGELRALTDAERDYICGCGWGVAETTLPEVAVPIAPRTADVVLTVKDVQHVSKARIK